MANLLCKGPDRNILGFAGHVVSVTATQICHCSWTATIGNTETNNCSCIPIRLYLQNQAAGWVWPMGRSVSKIILWNLGSLARKVADIGLCSPTPSLLPDLPFWFWWKKSIKDFLACDSPVLSQHDHFHGNLSSMVAMRGAQISMGRLRQSSCLSASLL